MTSLTAYHLTLCAMVAAAGLFGSTIGMVARYGSNGSALIGLLGGLIAGSGLAIAPAYMDSGQDEYREVVALRDADPRLAGEVRTSMSDGMLSSYEYQRITHIAADLRSGDATRSANALKRDLISREAPAGS